MDKEITVEQIKEAASGITLETLVDSINIIFKNFDDRLASQAAADEARRVADEARRVADEARRIAYESRSDEYKAEAEKSMKELRKEIGRVTGSIGQLTESMFSNVWVKFNEAFGFEFTGQGPHYRFMEGERVVAEADYFLENGEYILIIEVKTKMTEEHIKDHMERLEVIRKHRDACGDKRKIVGAAAGAVFHESVMKYALKNGLYVLLQSGEAVTLADHPSDFKAREW